MKKISFMITPVLFLLVMGAIAMPVRVGATGTTTECSVVATGTKNTAGNADSRFVLNGDGTVSAEFEVKGDANCKQDVLLASWQAPDGDKGRPYDQQKLYKYVTGNFGAGKHTLTVQLPDCYYQVDLVRGTVPTGQNGSPLYEKGRMMGSLHGGTKKCEETKKPETPTTPVTQQPATPQVAAAATTLPSTGAGSVLGLFAGTSAFGAAAHHFMVKRRMGRE